MASDRTALVLRAWGTAALSPETRPHGGAAPELAELGTPGWDSSRLWVGEDPRVMRDPPVALFWARGGLG